MPFRPNGRHFRFDHGLFQRVLRKPALGRFVGSVLSVGRRCFGRVFAEEERLRNIVVILADDMGFGEIQHLNPARGKIATLRLDQITEYGMMVGYEFDQESGEDIISFLPLLKAVCWNRIK